MSRAHLVLRLEAPLMSFGTAMTEQNGPTLPFPGLAMLTGLLANALGYRHGEDARLQALQDGLLYAVRADRPGSLLVDYQTVDLGQDFLRVGGWTTAGARDVRAGASSTGTQIRKREYWADAVYTVALRVEPQESDLDCDRLATALEHPARPLFLGRKPCLPSAPLLAGVVQAPHLHEALCQAPLHARAEPGPWRLWVPPGEGLEEGQGHALQLTDGRDWANQIHVGRRELLETMQRSPA